MQTLGRLEIYPRKILVSTVLAFGCGGLVLLSAFAIASASLEGIVGGTLGMGFFGVPGAWAILKFVRWKSWSLALTVDGIAINRPDGSALAGLIPWRDVETIGRVPGPQRSLGIGLANTDAYVESMGPSGRRLVIRQARCITLLDKLLLLLPTPQTATSAKYAKAAGEIKKASTVEEFLAATRANFGYDVLLGWVLLDRSRKDFEALLVQRWNESKTNVAR